MPMPQLSSSLSAAERMIHHQLIARGITDERVLEAMRSVPRESFVPPDVRDRAYDDNALPIGWGQTISQPYIVALMTQELQPQPGLKVLEIGTGSGYQAAVLAKLGMRVCTIERLKRLLDLTFDRLASLGIRHVHFRHGDGTRGWPEEAPFDRILITAGAPSMPADLLLSQLADGGVAVLPVGPMDAQMLLCIRRKGEELVRKDLCAVRFVKLVGEGAWEDV
jgi:protein-L-isoaspartate(D-aspartate) O-methyltransferase